MRLYFPFLAPNVKRTGHRTATAAAGRDQCCTADAGLLGWSEPM